jgi:lia operon protein LiaG
MSSRLARAAIVAASLLPGFASAQQVERFSLDGRTAAVYNLVGRMRVERGQGDKVVVEVTRAGADAGRLTIETGDVRGRSALRVRYPEAVILYEQSNNRGRSTFSVDDDGTFGDNDRGDRGDRRRIEVRSYGSGLDAHADLRVLMPNGARLFVRNGVGETTIDNVDGTLDVSSAAGHVSASHVRGALTIDNGSGGSELSDVTGDVNLDSGSGGSTLDGIRGGTLHMDVGSGSLRGRAIEMREIVADVGSGGVRLAGVKTQKLHLETGSGGSDVEFLAPVDDVHIEAGSGGVTLRLPSALNATLDIETGSGGIDTDFEVKVSRMERRALRGTVGDGRGRIRIESGSGNVRLLKT